MEIISIVSAKGGVSKSLLSINLYDYLKRDNKKVLLIDTDKQKSSFDFLKELNEEDISAVSTESDFDFVLAQAKKEKEPYDYIVVDTAPTITPLNAHIIKHSDKVLIAAKPARFDIKSIYNVVDLVKESKVKDSCILFTQTINNSTNTKKNLDELVEIFKQEDMKVLPCYLSNSMIYVNAINDLKTIFSTKHTKQKLELTKIYASLLSLGL